MMNAAREVVRHRGLRIDDPKAEKVTFKSFTRQAEELSNGASAQAGDFGRAGAFAHDPPLAGDGARRR
eukprot:4132573-Lingulodinium_polyedra.AAC.1